MAVSLKLKMLRTKQHITPCMYRIQSFFSVFIFYLKKNICDESGTIARAEIKLRRNGSYGQIREM